MARLTVPVSVTARHDKRLMRAGDDAELLWYRLLQLAKTLETDGIINRALIVREHRRAEKALGSLVAAGLVRDVGDDDFQLAGWTDWNPSVAEIQQKRADDRERKKRKPGGTHDPTPQDSVRIPSGIPADSGWIPPEEFRIPRREGKGREGKGREASNYQVGTSTVGAPTGFAPGRRNGEPLPLAAGIGTVMGALR